MTRLRLLYLAATVPLTESAARAQAHRDATTTTTMNYDNRAADLISKLRCASRAYMDAYSAALAED